MSSGKGASRPARAPLVRQGRLERHRGAGGRVLEAERGGVQGLARQRREEPVEEGAALAALAPVADRLTAVRRVADDGVARRLRVHADLVGAARL
jgi:hypothetical protein